MTKKMIAVVVAAGLSLSAGFAHADAGLAKAKNCTACHAMDKKLIGPGFKSIAEKYKADAGGPAKLVKKVLAGGVGVWGQVPMPPNPQVTEAEAQTLVTWILAM
ncbi:MAG: c-type cytochrome [Burkholderiaceae bacterium]